MQYYNWLEGSENLCSMRHLQGVDSDLDTQHRSMQTAIMK